MSSDRFLLLHSKLWPDYIFLPLPCSLHLCTCMILEKYGQVHETTSKRLPDYWISINYTSGTAVVGSFTNSKFWTSTPKLNQVLKEIWNADASAPILQPSSEHMYTCGDLKSWKLLRSDYTCASRTFCYAHSVFLHSAVHSSFSYCLNAFTLLSIVCVCDWCTCTLNACTKLSHEMTFLKSKVITSVWWWWWYVWNAACDTWQPWISIYSQCEVYEHTKLLYIQSRLSLYPVWHNYVTCT